MREFNAPGVQQMVGCHWLHAQFAGKERLNTTHFAARTEQQSNYGPSIRNNANDGRTNFEDGPSYT